MRQPDGRMRRKNFALSAGRTLLECECGAGSGWVLVLTTGSWFGDTRRAHTRSLIAAAAATARARLRGGVAKRCCRVGAAWTRRLAMRLALMSQTWRPTRTSGCADVDQVRTGAAAPASGLQPGRRVLDSLITRCISLGQNCSCPVHGAGRYVKCQQYRQSGDMGS
jgi:hypothetical protein